MRNNPEIKHEKDQTSYKKTDNRQTKEESNSVVVTSAAVELVRVSHSKFVSKIGEQSGRNFLNLKCGHRIVRERFQLHLNHCSESKSHQLHKLTLSNENIKHRIFTKIKETNLSVHRNYIHKLKKHHGHVIHHHLHSV